MEAIKVHVVDYGRACLYMRYTDPITGKFVTRTTKMTTRTAAEKEAGKWEVELREGRYKAPSRVTWKEFTKRYDDEVLVSLADSTAKKALAVFKAVETHVGPSHLSNLGAE